MPNPTAAMLVIGDEILSGRTRDANMYHLAGELTRVGVDLSEVRFVSDEAADIVAAVNDLRGRFTHVFTSGGIGPTHDDITADCVAEAFGVSIDVRADARAILATNYADPETELNESRLRMARVPDGAVLIDNPISKAPGFSIENVHVMAGVPKIFQVMLDGLLARIETGKPMISETFRVDRPEGQIAGPLREFAESRKEFSIGCYPFSLDGRLGCNIVVKGADARDVKTAAEALATLLTA